MENVQTETYNLFREEGGEKGVYMLCMCVCEQVTKQLQYVIGLILYMYSVLYHLTGKAGHTIEWPH